MPLAASLPTPDAGDRAVAVAIALALLVLASVPREAGPQAGADALSCSAPPAVLAVATRR
ncbi:MAG: hypothetical protein N2544_07685 [Burkholderiales bacterium]|nr:hypothetical protein [Burkholderiales bacterium]